MDMAAMVAVFDFCVIVDGCVCCACMKDDDGDKNDNGQN